MGDAYVLKPRGSFGLFERELRVRMEPTPKLDLPQRYSPGLLQNLVVCEVAHFMNEWFARGTDVQQDNMYARATRALTRLACSSAMTLSTVTAT